MLTNEDLTLRPYQRDDRELLVSLANNVNVCKYLTDQFPNPYTLEAADHWIAKTTLEDEQYNLAIEWRGQLVGGIGLKPFADIFHQTAEIGYWLGEPYWGNGLGTAALALMLDYAFSEFPFIRLQAVIFAENKNSVRVLEKNGFTCEGILRQHITKNGQVHDAAVYARLR